MFPTLPHTEEDVREMLAVIGAGSLDDLFRDIPEPVRQAKPLDLPDGISEAEVYRRLDGLAARNRTEPVCFLGAGSYDHLIPATVGAILSRSEFYTSYTPYQAEISQGVLQAIFEFQSLICQLTGLEVSNASLYDGHTAACEAASLALNSVRLSHTILYSGTLHPFTRRVLRTHFSGLEISLVEVAQREGITDLHDLKNKLVPGVAAVIVQSPNFLGYVEDFTGLAEMVHANGSLLIVSANPLSLGLLRSPGEWGADLALGDAQPCGLPIYFGGPTVGYLAATQALLHKMPGRISGQSLDQEGRRAYVLTLQAREQHIKRERAASNICSNQALAALAVAVYLSTVGREGLREVALQNAQKARYLHDRLARELPVRPLYDGPFFNEFPIVLPRDSGLVLQRMQEEGFFAGVQLGRLAPELLPAGAKDRALLVAVTEKRTREELDRYVETLRRILK